MALYKVQKWLDQGYSVGSIARIWNSGRKDICIKGVNSYGVPYDSCKYEQNVLAAYKK